MSNGGIEMHDHTSSPEAAAVLAGLNGYTDWGWLFVKLLWVCEPLRGTGMGSRLLAAAELEARARGCRGVWLDTFGFQARGFYEKQGYSMFGELGDFPEGHARYFLSKRLGA
jgi:GNAT superfamily N-acetyltransferase